jgi:hypothetical protein
MDERSTKLLETLVVFRNLFGDEINSSHTSIFKALFAKNESNSYKMSGPICLFYCFTSYNTAWIVMARYWIVERIQYIVVYHIWSFHGCEYSYYVLIEGGTR